jgi:hypothetical protein
MTFEDELRRRLHTNATDLDLHGHGPDATVGRARQRRHRRNAALGTVSGLALIAGAVGVVATRDPSDGRLAVGTLGLPQAGPLQLEWTTSEGGVTTALSSVVGPDGSIYALSTEPGFTDPSSTPLRTALYRHVDGGDWSARPGVGPDGALVDVAAGSSLLYGISTAPTEGGTGYGLRLSTSSDQGDSWEADDLPAIELPSDVVAWQAWSNVEVEARGSTAVAVVATSYYVPDSQLPGAEGLATDDLMRTYGDDGIVLGRVDRSGPSTTEAPTGLGADLGIPVLTVPWSDLGIDGADDLERIDVYVNDGSGWRTSPASPSLAGLGRLSVIGDEFVLSGEAFSDGPAGQVGDGVAYASSDGVSWREVTIPFDYYGVVGLGDMWVTRGLDGASLQVSEDRGATWRTIVLPDPTEASGPVTSIAALASGPLGLAVAVQGSGDGGLAAVMVTRDLESWTSFDLDGLGSQTSEMPTIVVGTDRIVVTLPVRGAAQPGEPSRSRTFVGTPVRVADGSLPPTTVTTASAAEQPPIVTSSTTTTTMAPPSTTTSVVIADGTSASTTSTATP